MKTNLTKLTHTALLIAVEIVLSRLCSLASPTLKIGIGFVPIVLVAILYGPLYAGVAGAMADFLGANLFPIAGYFPGFTLTAGLAGIVYGLLLYKKEVSWLRIAVAALVISLVLQLGIDTYWLYVLMHEGAFGLIPTRLLKCVIMIPLQIVLIRLVWAKICPLLMARSTGSVS